MDAPSINKKTCQDSYSEPKNTKQNSSNYNRGSQPAAHGPHVVCVFCVAHEHFM
jgi:hypothetical protein